jgi:hypothetical protein
MHPFTLSLFVLYLVKTNDTNTQCLPSISTVTEPLHAKVIMRLFPHYAGANTLYDFAVVRGIESILQHDAHCRCQTLPQRAVALLPNRDRTDTAVSEVCV